MNGVNLAIIFGTVVRDPEVKYTQSGTAICNITAVTNYSSKGEERPEFHRIVLFNRVAEIAGQYLKKGSQAHFTGRIQTRKWQDKDGADRFSTEIVAHEMQMGAGRGDSGNNASSGHTEAPAATSAPKDEFFDQDLPF